MLEAAENRGIEPWWYRVDFDGERQEHGFSHPAVLIDEPLPNGVTGQPGPSEAGGHLSKQWVERAVADTLRPSNHARHADAMVTAPDRQIELASGRIPMARAHRIVGPSVPSKATCHGLCGRKTENRFGHLPPTLGELVCENSSPLVECMIALGLGFSLPVNLGSQHHELQCVASIPMLGKTACSEMKKRIIQPAIELAQGQYGNDGGTQITGPWPGDTVWKSALAGKHDVVVAMYHDQGLIPAKLVAPEGAVSLTLGLPVVRTSPDHGTAFDIAGLGKADDSSMKRAIELALDLIPVGTSL